MSQNENQLINLFNEYLHDEASRLSASLHDFSLGGQDRILGADWLYRANGLFMLVEFKAINDGYLTEKKKPLRAALCLQLARNQMMRDRHERCHFIAWGDNESLYANIYRRQVCNTRVFPSLDTNAPDLSNLMGAESFSRSLLSIDTPQGLPLQEFEAYLCWLRQIDDSDGPEQMPSAVQLIARDKSRPGFATKVFNSVSALDQWIRSQPQPSSSPTNQVSPDSERPGGTSRP
jgi:hypothetical protein